MFEVGEQIECVKDNNNVTIGSTYKVVNVSASVVEIINDVGSKNWYYIHVFKKYSDVVNPEEYVELDPKIYAEHELREEIDEIINPNYFKDVWQKVSRSAGETVKFFTSEIGYKVRCRRKHLPVLSATDEAVAKLPDEVTSPQRAVAKTQPFDGAGRYRLKNGQIVNLNENRACKKSDGIIAKDDICCGWNWSPDGSIEPANMFGEELYLAEKLVPESIDKVKQLKSFGFTMADDIPPKGIKCGTTDFVGGSVELDSMAYSTKDIENVKSLLANNAGRGMMDLVWASEPSARSEKSLKMDQEANLDGTMDPSILLGSGTSVSDINNVLKGNNVKRETVVKIASATGKFLLSTAFKAVNYWVVGPAITLGRPVVNSVRYATFLASLAAVGYACYHPTAATAAKDAVADVFWSCIPTISIEGPAILRDTTSK